MHGEQAGLYPVQGFWGQIQQLDVLRLSSSVSWSTVQVYLRDFAVFVSVPSCEYRRIYCGTCT